MGCMIAMGTVQEWLQTLSQNRSYQNFKHFWNMSQEVQQHILLRYDLITKVGSGAYGHVWKAVDKRTKAVVALKKIFDAFQHSTDAQRTFREITLLHDIKHTNIIQLHNVFRAENDKDIYLVFQYMESDLYNVISKRILQDIHNRFIMYQICKALKYLHSADLIHRDLKPSNVLLNSDSKLKLCDFGLVRCLATEKEGDNLVLTEEVATRWYRAPEVLLGSKTYDRPADMWSVGCILAEMLIYKPIFPGSSTMNQLQKILSFTGKPSNQQIASLESELAVTMINSIKAIKYKQIKQWFNSSVNESAIDLVTKLLQFNPQKRLTAVEALNHPYLSQFSNKKEEVVATHSIKPPIDDNKKLSLKQYRNILYDYIKRTYKQDNTSKTAVEPKPKLLSREKDKLRRSINHTQHSANNSIYNKSGMKESAHKYPSTSNLSKSILKEKEQKLVRDEKRSSTSNLLKKELKSTNSYSSKYYKQYLGGKYDKENVKKY